MRGISIPGRLKTVTFSNSWLKGTKHSALRRDQRWSSRVSSEEEEFLENLDQDNQQALDLLESLDGESFKKWEFIAEKNGVKVYRGNVRAGPFVKKSDLDKGMKHACVKSVALLDAKPDDVFNLFLSNDRVHEYNEHCEEVKDVKIFPKLNGVWCKVSWARSPNYGMFKPRDFFSVVCCTKKRDGSYWIMNRPAYLHWSHPDKQYVRATILLAGNIIRPVDNGKKSHVTLIAHVNPGGGGDTQTAAWMINKFCAVSPPVFMKKLEKAANRR